DLDDTLLDTGKYYHRQLDLVISFIKEKFPEAGNSEDILDVYYSIDSESIEANGYDKAHFPESMVATFEHYCREYDYSASREELEECAGIGWEVYARVPEKLNDIAETLEKLRENYGLILYTMGDAQIQLEKIAHHELEHWFDELHVVPLKETHYLKKIAGFYPREQVMVVGDSLRGEIQPALQLGMRAVYRKSNFPWSFHEVEVEGEFPTIKELPELFDLLP
ncbi:MAG: HAD family hydrolase, partial [bacterium]